VKAEAASGAQRVASNDERALPRPHRFVQAVLPMTLIVLFLPLVVMVITSLRNETGWTFQWYTQLASDAALLDAATRSFAVAFAVAMLSTALAVCNAMAVHRWLPRFRSMLDVLGATSLMLPELVLGLSLLAWFGILGLQLNLTTVIIAHTTLTLPFSTLVILSRLAEFDSSVEDAARDLGASERQVFLQVTLPLLRPALMGAFILAFLLSFDDFLITYFTNGVGQDTLPVLLYSLMRTGTTPKILALSSLMMAFSVSLLLILSRLQKSVLK
jgi:spermidine/putrescine transport system permease protein